MTEESAAVDWWTADQVRARMVPAFAIRVLDALDTGTLATREHNG